jgi:hypothetical protein
LFFCCSFVSFSIESKEELKNLLDKREIYWIEKDKTFIFENNFGYNMTKGGKSSLGTPPWNKGKKGIYSYETIELMTKKLKEILKGKKAFLVLKNARKK